jgi:Type I phosphodiesterase / nucleotide pyrophosphatase
MNSATPRLVVLSIDGMRPDFYRNADLYGLKVPNLRELVDSGASAGGVESVYPSTTYPAHATIVTGVLPRRHRIYSHLASVDAAETHRDWTWFAGGMQAPAIWDAASQAGKRIAALSWPVSVGARIDLNIPEIWDVHAPDPQRDFATAARFSTPGLFANVLGVLQPIFPDATPDHLRAEAAIHLWRAYGPDLLMVHFLDYDQTAHSSGPTSPGALQAIELVDAEIGRVRDVVASDPNASLMVISDHGFVPVEKEAAPLVALQTARLFRINARSRLASGRLGAIHAGGSFAVYWMEEPDPSDRRRLDRALAKLQGSGAVAEVIDRRRLAELGADPDAELMLDAAPGYYFSDRFEGPLIRETQRDRGTHGQLPWRSGLEASFMVVGPGVRKGKDLGRFSLTRLAPTMATILGLPAGLLASTERPLALE